MNAGLYYFNYEIFHSIFLMALVGGDYKFTWWKLVQMVLHRMRRYSKTGLKEAIEQHVIDFPPPDHLPADNRDTPYFFVGDDAFPLHTYMVKPYGRLGLEVPERIYNYRTSRCRRVCENAFGILANRYACLLSVIKFEPNIATNIILTTMCCHNLMCMRYPAIQNAAMDREDDNNNMIPVEWRRGNTWIKILD